MEGNIMARKKLGTLDGPVEIVAFQRGKTVGIEFNIGGGGKRKTLGQYVGKLSIKKGKGISIIIEDTLSDTSRGMVGLAGIVREYWKDK